MEKTMDEWMVFIADQQKNSIPRLHSIFRRQMEAVVLAKMEARGYANFKVGHLVLLANIQPTGSISNEMAKLAQISKQGMNKVVQSLKEQGYLYTEDHPTDRRAQMIKFTEKGKVFRYDLYMAVQEIRADFEKSVGAEEMAQFEQTLSRLVKMGMTNISS